MSSYFVISPDGRLVGAVDTEVAESRRNIRAQAVRSSPLHIWNIAEGKAIATVGQELVKKGDDKTGKAAQPFFCLGFSADGDLLAGTLGATKFSSAT